MPAGLNDPVTALRGAGPAVAQKLEKLAVTRVEDLLFLLPLRYEDRTRITRIGAARPGTRCLVSGDVLLAETVYRGRRSLLVRIADGSGQLTLRFFHFSRAQERNFRRDARVMCYGDVRSGPAGPEMIHPEYRLLRADETPEVSNALTPVYPSTEGIQQRRLRGLAGQALALMHAAPPEELLPADVRAALGMPSLEDALGYLHQPPPEADCAALAEGRHPCQKRLAFEELLAHYLSLRRTRRNASREQAAALAEGDPLVLRFTESLPFRLTGAQRRVEEEIRTDLARPRPMLRLIQGDVGSGKTVVAAIACLRAVASGLQAAVMAPTELLAEQHLQSFRDWFEPLGIEVAWLSGRQGRKSRRDAIETLARGDASVVVGTHALFQEGVAFRALALVVIDEQHRFGVHQRLALRDKGQAGAALPHQLVMTATPIPRTLAMAAYADLDTSVIDELPPGRTPVRTVALPESRREEIVSRVRDACAGGQQAYWVCPLIETSEVLDVEAAEARFAQLADALPELSIGLVHGRMKAAQKERAMRAFKGGELHVLVATTVIEVGVDVPNATLMIVENAERMGLSQLHQLRGRVGRGKAQSHCVLVYKPPLGALAKSRLAVLRDTNDGFLVAERDLELRGPGELLGTRQTGLPEYRIADLARDSELMPKVQRVAAALESEHPDAAERIVTRWLAGATRYVHV